MIEMGAYYFAISRADTFTLSQLYQFHLSDVLNSFDAYRFHTVMFEKVFLSV